MKSSRTKEAGDKPRLEDKASILLEAIDLYEGGATVEQLCRAGWSKDSACPDVQRVLTQLIEDGLIRVVGRHPKRYGR
jgi:hypothetical protein